MTEYSAETEQAGELSGDSATLPTDPPANATPPTDRRRTRWLKDVRIWLVVLLVAIASFLSWRWYTTADELDALRTQNAQRDKAAAVAEDYTARSLTYDYKNLDAFFAGVRDGASDGLKDRYGKVHDTLTKIMTEAQVVATGEVVATAVESVSGDRYEVTVFASQKTQNVQQPDPASVPNLLSVTVERHGDKWVVAAYGPR